MRSSEINILVFLIHFLNGLNRKASNFITNTSPCVYRLNFGQINSHVSNPWFRQRMVTVCDMVIISVLLLKHHAAWTAVKTEPSGFSTEQKAAT